MNIFDYTDYRKYLYDYYIDRKSKNSYFTVRYIAEQVGFSSASFFSQLIKGRSNISIELARKFALFLKLNKSQSDYFETLILYNQSKNHEQKKNYFDKLSSFRLSRVKRIDAGLYEFYDKWYYSAIRELLYIHVFTGDFKELAKLLEPSISPSDTQKAITRLEKWGMIKKNENGRFIRSDDQSITCGVDAQSFYINNFQLTALKLAADAVDNFGRNEREFSTLTMSLSRNGYEKFIDELREFRRRLLSIAEQDSLEDRVYQLNLQLFPLTKRIMRNNS